MTKLLEDVFRRASELPEDRQDELAVAIEAAIEAEDAWAVLLSRSQEALASLADEALEEKLWRRIRPVDPGA